MMWSALRQHCRCEMDWRLRWWQRFGYTFKFLVCFMLRREYAGRTYDWDHIEVACLASGSAPSMEWGTTYWAEMLAVGQGWRNWCWTTYDVGSP